VAEIWAPAAPEHRRAIVVAVVDDEEAVREATESLLRSAGFGAETYASAEDFLRSRRHAVVGCLVVDIALPGMTGLELQRYLTASGSRVPIVFITAHDDSDGRMQAQALQAGAIAFLHKPFGDDDLLNAVQVAVGREK
jgi:FixJ family two-component response regulator